jgi:hypothetical protein
MGRRFNATRRSTLVDRQRTGDLSIAYYAVPAGLARTRKDGAGRHYKLLTVHLRQLVEHVKGISQKIHWLAFKSG